MRMRMHGWSRAGEERKRKARHMCTVPSRGSAVIAPVDGGGASPSSLNSASFFRKDGRKISVGDCALFKPPQDSPPYIGIIRSVNSCGENKLKLIVNWLYRPSEVKLGKGFFLESAPNEIFYSFNKDEIPAASLLHPCKVAFLPKGVELPSGIGSFVCRRVYDITNKCLRWLTDQDYINERQQEVDQLLCKTRIEMHGTNPQGGRSPRPTNGPTSTAQLKSGSESAQNSPSFPAQVKGKKRERGEQGSEPVKRERSVKMEDGEPGHSRVDSEPVKRERSVKMEDGEPGHSRVDGNLKSEIASEPVKRERSVKMEDGEPGHSRVDGNLKSEIAKITEKGGLVDYEGVEKLVQLMSPERNDKRIDLVCRSILAGVVAATDKFDCLNQFVQLRGLHVLDDWLQQVNKGKIGDGSSPKDGDKPVEEFLLVLLRALDKLPVNLHALQMCNIGKSVNQLRTHKNLEIQKKARSLVDTWKKRVEAEMDAKSGSNQAVSWSTRPRLPDAHQGTNKQSGGLNEVAVKSMVSQLAASKTSSVKLVQAETTTRSAFASPGSLKSPLPASLGANAKDAQHRNVSAADRTSSQVKDEKSSSSSQSHNSSQSSSDHAKIGDARSSTAGSMTVNKTSSGSSRSRKSVNGFPGSNVSGVQRDTGSTRSSTLHRNSVSERLSQSNSSCEKAHDVPTVEGSNHKLIVKIPNRGRSPAQSASGGSFEDHSVSNSRASSPLLSERQEQPEHAIKDKVDSSQTNIPPNVNSESWQGNDVKEAHAGSDTREGLSAALAYEKGGNTARDTKKIVEITKSTSSPSGNERKAVRLHDVSLSSINALIESCVKYSEADASAPVGDDIGMNLLASVAAGEMSKSEIVSPVASPQRKTTICEHSSDDNESRVKSFSGAELSRVAIHFVDGADEKGNNCILSEKNTESNEEKPAADQTGRSNVSPIGFQQTFKTNQNSKQLMTGEETFGGAGKSLEGKAAGRVEADGISDTKKISSSLLTEGRVPETGMEIETEAIEGSSSFKSSEINGENKKSVNDGYTSGMHADPRPPCMTKHSESLKREDEASEHVDQVMTEKADEAEARNCDDHCDKLETEQKSHAPVNHKDPAAPSPALNVNKSNRVHVEENSECNESKEFSCVGQAPPKASSMAQVPDMKPRDLKLTSFEGDGAQESTPTTADASCSASRVSNMEAKMEIDLNEGLDGDDGKCGETSNFTDPGCSSAVQEFINTFAVSSLPSNLPASITVAAAAKGRFVPPEDLLRSKGALGWKGSAATSAFRPAEPRKVLEMPLGATSVSSADGTPGKESRPPLDIDLNVADERILEDLASRSSGQGAVSQSRHAINLDASRDGMTGPAPSRYSGGLDLDLNRVEDSSDMVANYSTSNGCRMEIPLNVMTSSSGSLPNGESKVHRDFDLNDGPVVDEASTEPSLFNQHNSRNSLPSQPPVFGLRMNTAEAGSFSSWFPRANTYSTITVPSILPDRGDQPFPIVTPGGPQRMLAPPSGPSPFGADVYRAPVLSSSPAVPFPSTAFQYPVFPFGANYPHPSATFSVSSTPYVDTSSSARLCFPTVSSQFLGPASAVQSPYQRPYVVSVADGNNTMNAASSLKWGRQGLDLNAGPGVSDIEGRDETSPLAARQLPVANSHSSAEEQARIYQLAGGMLKRKEPEGGWDGYKRPAWP